VRHVTRTVLTIGAMAIGSGAASAQPPEQLRKAVLITEMPLAAVNSSSRSPKAVLERVLSFDANGDQRISREELPERMQGLIARGDKNADAALDSEEIRALMNAEPPSRRVVFPSPSSEGLVDIVHDLKLPPAKHQQALAIVAAHKMPRNFNDPASADLSRQMRAVLDDEEYENFVAAATRLSRSPQVRFRTGTGGVVGGVVGGIRQ